MPDVDDYRTEDYADPETECPFCAIVDGDEPASVVFEDDTAIAFLDVAPITEGHTPTGRRPARRSSTSTCTSSPGPPRTRFGSTHPGVIPTARTSTTLRRRSRTCSEGQRHGGVRRGRRRPSNR